MVHAASAEKRGKMTETVTLKKFSELLVKDLRAELEKRGLDHKGVKAVLLERLQEVHD